MSRLVAIIIGVIAIGAVLLWVASRTETYKMAAKGSPDAGTTLEETNVENWHLWSPPNGHFQIFLPALPQTASSNIPDPESKKNRLYNTYISPKDENLTYIINFISYSDEKEAANQKGILKKIINEMLSTHPNNNLKEIKDADFKNLKSVDFTIENQNSQVKGKAIRDGHHLIVLTVFSKDGKINPAEYAFFVNSFDLLEKPAEGSKK